MLLFLDCEWADMLEPELVSLAIIGEDSAYTFYAERERLPASAPLFVQEVVYPLLDRGTAVMSDLGMTHALRDFFRAVPNPIVVADYPLDFELLRSAVEGLGLLAIERAVLGPAPTYEMLLASDPELHASIEARFDADPEMVIRRHHASVDAQVLRDAWIALGNRS